MDRKRSLRAASAACALIITTTSYAGWSGHSMNLPELQSTVPHFGALDGCHLSDGRFVYGNNARLFIQDAFGSSSFTQINNAPVADPSFVTVVRDPVERIVLGAGGFGDTSLFFSQADYAGGADLAFAASAYQLQNYSAAFYDGRLYVAGCNDSFTHAVSAVEGANPPVLLIRGISTYSAGIAVDRTGNLFAASSDDNRVYRFSKAQLDAAFASQTPLTLADGVFVVQFSVSTTLAVDEYGCLWAAGWQTPGIEIFNPRLGTLFTTVPSRTNSNYKVNTFTRNGTPYVAYLNQAGWTTGSAVEYGCDFAAKFARDENRDFHSGLTNACDIVVYEFATGSWLIRHPDRSSETRLWGWSSAFPVPADYDGDGITDVAVYAAERGEWIIRRSSDQAPVSQNWGWSEAQPVPADYDGDGVADFAVYFPPTGQWTILSSLTGQGIVHLHGWSEALPVAADYDGDGRADVAVYDFATGSWIIRSSATGELIVLAWGWNEAWPMPGDYDGDGVADAAVYHPQTATWCIRNSSDPANPTVRNWGWQEAYPVPADYDGDGRTDMAVYHPASGTWIILESSNPTEARTESWGWSDGFPATSSAFLNAQY